MLNHMFSNGMCVCMCRCVCVCRCECIGMCVSVCVDVCVGGGMWISLICCVHVLLFRGSEDSAEGSVVPCTMWVRGIRIRLSDLEVSTFPG